MKLLAIIINYKTADMTVQAVEAVMHDVVQIPGARLIIVDNLSQDGSIERMQAALANKPWRDRLDIVDSGANGGFGAGNNFAIRRNLSSTDKADYFYLLNSDAFPEPGAVQCLVDFLDKQGHVGIAGSYIQGPEKNPHDTAFRFPSLLSELEAGLGLGIVSRLLHKQIVSPGIPDHTCQVEWLAGASMMIRRKVLETIGLFDENFFLYFEETDLCRRASSAGFPTFYVRESVVTHIGSVSTGMKDKSRPMPRFWWDSRHHYFKKHHGELYLTGSNVVWAAGHLLWQARKILQRKTDPHPPGLLIDFLRYNFLPGGRDRT